MVSTKEAGTIMHIFIFILSSSWCQIRTQGPSLGEEARPLQRCRKYLAPGSRFPMPTSTFLVPRYIYMYVCIRMYICMLFRRKEQVLSWYPGIFICIYIQGWFVYACVYVMYVYVYMFMYIHIHGVCVCVCVCGRSAWSFLSARSRKYSLDAQRWWLSSSGMSIWNTRRSPSSASSYRGRANGPRSREVF